MLERKESGEEGLIGSSKKANALFHRRDYVQGDQKGW